MVLERPGHDLRGRGGAGIHEHHERGPVDQVPRRGVHLEAGIGGAAIGGDDDAGLQEVIRNRHTGLEDSAWIVSQVEHKTLDSARIVSL